ncbi:MAG: hypothetical protein L0H36_01945 [bacterium]|nr:hypothetical protein [bacterium]MDN5835376.1 hypothetical protein [bacterium]
MSENQPAKEFADLRDITGKDKVILLKTETDCMVRYGVYTEVDGMKHSYYEHFAGTPFGQGLPDCDLIAFAETQMWVFDQNPNCQIEIR